MIKKQEILHFAKKLSLTANTIEKDYVLNWLLIGIFTNDELSDNWIFKGGTCLKKCYFKEYRFSEDLDFTITNKQHLEIDFLKAKFVEVGEYIYELSGISMPENSITFESYLNPRGEVSVEGKVGYIGPMKRKNSITRVKLDLTNDEVICSKPVRNQLYHPYSDSITELNGILTYDLEEIFAEKTRALAERMRPRDLYDVVHLYNKKRKSMDIAKYIKILNEKCLFKGMSMPTYEQLSKKPEILELESEWENMLSHQIGNLASCQHYWNQLPKIFNWIQENSY